MIYKICLFALAFFLQFTLPPNIASADAPFNIGVVVPLTGPTADYGIAIQNSINLAVKDRPELFADIKFNYEDAQGNPSNAVSAFNKLLAANQMKISLTWGVAFCKALAPIAEGRKVPLVGLCLDPTAASNRRYVLRFKNTTDEIMATQAKYLLKNGVKKIGLIQSEHPYFEELTEALQRNLLEGQTLTIIDQVPTTQLDLRPSILKIKNKLSDYDSVGVFLWIGQVANFYRQLKELSINLPTFGSDLFESISEIKAANGLMDGIPFSGIEIRPEFIKRYKAIYHSESQLAFGAPAYEFAITVGELFGKNSANLSAEEIVNKFSLVSPRPGVAAGPYKYINDSKVGQYFQFPIVIKKIKGDAFEIAQ